jgi:hypothetical protein
VHTPDDKIGWIPFAVYRGIRVIRREIIEIIFSTSPPESGHLVALWISKLTGKPMVVDFRDPWTTHYTKQNLPVLADSLPHISPTRLRIEKWLEEKVLTRARYIIHTGEGRAGLVHEAFPEIPMEKHVVITNGYDEADFKGLPEDSCRSEDHPRFLNLVNIGQIYIDAPFGQFLGGLKKALNDYSRITGDKNPPDIRMTFVVDSLGEWANALSEPIFRDRMKLVGFKPHREAIKMMMEADVLLLFLPQGDKRMRDKIIAGRTFEFMRSGRPILMVGWEGESSRILERSGLGTFVYCEDTDGISRAIVELYLKRMRGELTPKPDWGYIKCFDRLHLTEELGRLFDSVVGK